MFVYIAVNVLSGYTQRIQINNPIPDVITMNEERKNVVIMGIFIIYREK